MTSTAALSWLLEPANPSARYLTLTNLLDRPADDREVLEARSAISGWGPARAMLDAQWPGGYWVRPGTGYSPKYKATVWQVIFLAALGAPRTEAIDRACTYVLDNSRLPDGRFSAYKTALGAVACLNGNLVRAMHHLGCDDPRLDESLEALAQMVAHDRFCCRFNAASPLPARMREGLPCAWGAIKTLGALAEVSQAEQSAQVRAAIQVGIKFLLEGDLATGEYPTATAPSPLWQRFGFPLGYTSDLLEGLQVLAKLGVAGHPRLATAVEVVQHRQDGSGRWQLDHTPENTWAHFGQRGQPSKWLTLRALCVLRDLQEDQPLHDTEPIP